MGQKDVGINQVDVSVVPVKSLNDFVVGRLERLGLKMYVWELIKQTLSEAEKRLS